MNSNQRIRDNVQDLRRDFHAYPEPSWCEFRTTARLIQELREIGVDELYVGSEAMDPDERMEVPNQDELDRWYRRARESMGDPSPLASLENKCTGVVAVLHQGSGPTVGLRVDIDALPITESRRSDHIPAAKGFRSTNDGTMHACGHDAHMTIGLGTLEEVKESEFSGTLKIFFQPAEEVGGGGKPMSRGDLITDVQYLFAIHIGLGHPSGEVVAGVHSALALSNLTVEFDGVSAHAGNSPHAGRNTVQALASAIKNLYSIPRHGDGLTRVNVGNVRTTNSTSVVADHAEFEYEIRGGTNDLMEYMKSEAKRGIEAAATAHDCSVNIELLHETIRADSDRELAEVVYDQATSNGAVDSAIEWAELGVSEDACYLMDAVQSNGGKSVYSIIGTEHPTGHHTKRFDIDEASIEIGIDVLSKSIERTSRDQLHL